MSDSGPSFGSAHDPWDAPYFGAPVYLSYPVFRGAAPGAVNGVVAFHGQMEPNYAAPVESLSDHTPTTQQVEPAPAEPTAPPTPAPRRRGWFSRLFGAR